jgi:pyridoxamine 5'-phosphate oxidase
LTDLDPAADPFDLFARWFAEASASEPSDPNAMTLATAAADGSPSARVVLLKGWDAQGFLFYTHAESRKGREIAANPRVHLAFHWKSLRRQVRIDAMAAPVPREEADAYFASRPRESQLGAWASLQSQPLADRATLLSRLEEAEARFRGRSVPRPPGWWGYRAAPRAVEFWQEGAHRLHQRLLFRRTESGWSGQLLYP